MTTLRCCVLALLVLCSMAAAAPTAPVLADGVAVVEVQDGSRLVGTLAGAPLELTTAYGVLRIPLDQVRRLDAVGPTVKIRDRAGDRFSGTLAQGIVAVTASFGVVDVPIDRILVLDVVQPPVGGSDSVDED